MARCFRNEKSTFVVFLLLTVITWNVFTYVLVGLKANDQVGAVNSDIENRLNSLNNVIESHIEESELLLLRLRTMKAKELEAADKSIGKDSPMLKRIANVHRENSKFSAQNSNVTIAVLVVACNRPDAIDRSLNQLLKYRFSVERFPIVVSQDCGHWDTTAKIKSFGNQVTLIQQPDLSEPVVPQNHNNFRGYYKISRHYKWMLSYAFNQLKYDTVLVVEDDLDISPDFFEYFAATYPILHADPTLWCVSAWNDNGKGDIIENNAELLYRTDFFPGLGWMLEKRVWAELEPKWPAAFWDDWMREPSQRRDRACIRPEISRTSTFGRVGVSKGQFFDKYLRFIKLNQESVPFHQRDLSYLMQTAYDSAFAKTVYSAPAVSMEELLGGHGSDARVVRVEYANKDAYKALAKHLQLMDDFKSGVPRTAYRGIVSVTYQGRRVYIAPPLGWSRYDTSW